MNKQKVSDKVIFLDIDGVIQSPRYCVAINQSGWMSTFEPAAMSMLRNLINESGAKIVISSTWRLGEYDSVKRELQLCFRVCGFKEIANAFHSDWRTDDNGKLRGDEIKRWLDKHPECQECYLILDDDADMLEEQKPFFVQTDCYNGMLLEHYDKAKKILKINIDD